MSSARTRQRPGWARQALLVAGKDLQIELSTGEIVTTAGFFAILVAVIASIAFFAEKQIQTNIAPGVIWVAVAFATVLALSRTWQREREDNALLGLLVTPLSRSAIFAGKALGVAAFISVVQLIVIGAATVLFGLDISKIGGNVLLLAVGSTPGIAAAGTLFGSMTIRTRARDLVLASVLLPLISPSVLVGVAGTRAAIGGVPLAQLTDYFLLDLLFAGVFVAGGLGLFETLIEG